MSLLLKIAARSPVRLRADRACRLFRPAPAHVFPGPRAHAAGPGGPRRRRGARAQDARRRPRRRLVRQGASRASRPSSISTATAAALPTAPRASSASWAQGWGVYMMTYRGYGGGTGSPTETANVADARLAYGALVLEGVEPASIILYGESLGSGIAVRHRRRAAGRRRGARCALHLDRRRRRAGLSVPARAAAARRSLRDDQVHRPGAGAAADPARRAR